MKKELRNIFIVLILFGFGEGFFYNFLELWMQDNNLSVKTVSTILSLCSLIAVLSIFLFSNVIKKQHLKKFVSILLLLKAVILFLLFFLNHTGQSFFIKFFILLERAIDTEITVCIYPLMSLVKMDDKTYGKKDIVYNFVYYISLLLSGLLLGKSLVIGSINYNTYAIVSGIIIFISFVVLSKMKIPVKKEPEDDKDEIIVFELIKKIVNDKPSNHYFAFLLFGQISYYTITGLTMTFLTDVFKFEPTLASNIRVYLGIASAVFAMFALRFLTFKNDVININIKYTIRIILFALALILMGDNWYFLAFAAPRFLSTCYSHVTDAPYINRFSGKYQFAFCNLREMVVYLGCFVGYWLCGVCYKGGIWHNVLWAMITLVISLVFAFFALYYRNKEKHDRK